MWMGGTGIAHRAPYARGGNLLYLQVSCCSVAAVLGT